MKVFKAVIDKAGKTKEERRIMHLEETFRHYHVYNGIDDSCKQCGLDLRDLVHRMPAL